MASDYLLDVSGRHIFFGLEDTKKNPDYLSFKDLTTKSQN